MRPVIFSDGSARTLSDEEAAAAMGRAPAPLSDGDVERILAERDDPADRPDPDA